MTGKRAATAGFTLIEMMVCVAIFALIALAVQGIFNSVMKVWAKGDARLAMYQNARAAMDHISVGMRSTVRPDQFDSDHDGDIDASDVGVGGVRFLGVNKANQAAVSPIVAGTSGAGQGYKNADQISYICAMYGTRYEQSDIIGYSYGIFNTSGAVSPSGTPVMFEAKLGSCAAREFSGGVFRVANSVRVDPLITFMLPDAGTSEAGRMPSFYHISDFQIEFHTGNVAVTTKLSGSTYYDSSQNSGQLPSMVRLEVASDPTIPAIPDPIYVGTYVSLKRITGVSAGTIY